MLGYGSINLWVGDYLCRFWVWGCQVMGCDTAGSGGIRGVDCVGYRGVVGCWWEWDDIRVICIWVDCLCVCEVRGL